MRKIIGVTGSIASGKSYCMNNFKNICASNNIEAKFLYVDDIRRKILDDYKIDRNKLNKLIYDSVEKMNEYKNFINPKIKRFLIDEINNYSGFVFIEWALLIEDNFFDIVDSIIMVNCDRNIQIERLKNGDLSENEVIKRIDIQFSNLEKIKILERIAKNFKIINTDKNPKIYEYESLLKEVGIYE